MPAAGLHALGHDSRTGNDLTVVRFARSAETRGGQARGVKQPPVIGTVRSASPTAVIRGRLLPGAACGVACSVGTSPGFGGVSDRPVRILLDASAWTAYLTVAGRPTRTTGMLQTGLLRPLLDALDQRHHAQGGRITNP